MTQLELENIKQIAKTHYPEKWEHYHNEYQWNDGWHDENEEARNAFIAGMIAGMKK